MKSRVRNRTFFLSLLYAKSPSFAAVIFARETVKFKHSDRHRLAIESLGKREPFSNAVDCTPAALAVPRVVRANPLATCGVFNAVRGFYDYCTNDTFLLKKKKKN